MKNICRSLVKLLFPEKKERVEKFKYKYQRHPFDDWNFFQILAIDQKEADEKATTEFGKIFLSRETVLTRFYRA